MRTEAYLTALLNLISNRLNFGLNLLEGTGSVAELEVLERDEGREAVRTGVVDRSISESALA